jgi:hypothetical protein
VRSPAKWIAKTNPALPSREVLLPSAFYDRESSIPCLSMGNAIVLATDKEGWLVCSGRVP